MFKKPPLTTRSPPPPNLQTKNLTKHLFINKLYPLPLKIFYLPTQQKMSDTFPFDNSDILSDDIDSDSLPPLVQKAPLHRIFAFLPLTDTLRCQMASLRMRNHGALHFKNKEALDLSEFWWRLGHSDPAPVIRLCSRFENLKRLSLAFCSGMVETDFGKILRAVTKKNCLEMIDLFFCPLLTDKAVGLVAQLVPNVQYLDLGHGYRLTDQSVGVLASLPRLHTLVLVFLLHFWKKS